MCINKNLSIIFSHGNYSLTPTRLESVIIMCSGLQTLQNAGSYPYISSWETVDSTDFVYT